jgi:hypothetical protein
VRPFLFFFLLFFGSGNREEYRDSPANILADRTNAGSTVPEHYGVVQHQVKRELEALRARDREVERGRFLDEQLATLGYNIGNEKRNEQGGEGK